MLAQSLKSTRYAKHSQCLGSNETNQSEVEDWRNREQAGDWIRKGRHGDWIRKGRHCLLPISLRSNKKIRQSLNKLLAMVNLNQYIPMQQGIINPYDVSFIFRFAAMLLACARGHVLWRFSTASTKKYCL